MRRLAKVVAVFLLVSFVVVSAGPSRARAAESLSVAGAADLAFAMKELAAGFEDETGVKVVTTLGSTGLLTYQISHGAPFDVFFAANVSYVERLEEEGRVLSDTVELYAQGRVVLVVNKASGLDIGGLDGLLGEGARRVAIANPDHAPYGVAAMEALKSSGLWDELRPRLVYGENVRQTLQFVQTGDAQAGIVALSIAAVPEVSSSPIDPALHNPINQAAAVVAGTEHEGLARRFIKYVNGPEGRRVMKKYGFFLPGEL